MRNKICLLLTALTICACCFASQSGAGQGPLRINCTLHSPYEAFFFRLVEAICARQDIRVERNAPPVSRSLIHVNQGIDDGDGPRIGGLTAAYPNLVQVPEPFGDFIFGAFAKSRKIHIDGWSGLKKLNVAYIHGWKIFDINVAEAKSITKVRNKDLLFGLLDAGRADVVLLTKLAGYAQIQRMGLENIHFIEPPLALEPNYLYLHKRHSVLAARLAATLRTLKGDGTYRRLYREMIFPYLPK